MAVSRAALRRLGVLARAAAVLMKARKAEGRANAVSKGLVEWS
jgi:hypothetical protein